jgi:hypothetical protein
MSQKKVDEYKKQKQNRQQIMRRERRVRRLEITAIVVILAGLISWFSVAVYHQASEEKKASATAETIDLNLDDIQDYLQDLSSSATADTSSTSGDTTAASSSSAE